MEQVLKVNNKIKAPTVEEAYRIPGMSFMSNELPVKYKRNSNQILFDKVNGPFS